jgi:hypothetical protein
MQQGMHRHGHRYGFRDVLTGFLSMRRATFTALGGFDAAMYCHEDYELGYRALRSGLRLQFVRSATALHHDSTTLAKSLQRKYDEGIADVHLSIAHPALIPALPFSWEARWSWRKRLLRRLAWSSPSAGDLLAATLQRLLPPLEAVKLRFRWRRLVEGLLDYHYWRGIAAASGTRRRLAEIAATAPQPPEPVAIDLSCGLEAAEQRVEALRPESIRFVFGGTTIGTVPYAPGLEPLRAGHVRPLAAQLFSWPLLCALAEQGEMPGILRAAFTRYVQRQHSTRAARTSDPGAGRPARREASSPHPTSRSRVPSSPDAPRRTGSRSPAEEAARST